MAAESLHAPSPPGAVEPRALTAALGAAGFMPPEEGAALHAAALGAPGSTWVEVGTYAGRSTCFLGAAARTLGALLFTVDHHRGSEENQPGEEFHDPAFVDGDGRVDTLPAARRTLAEAGLEDCVVLVCGASRAVAARWREPLGLLFLDGGHSPAVQHGDYDAWAPHLARGGVLLIHDVFPDPRDGGRPPYEVYVRALADGFVEVGGTGSLRVLTRP